MITESQLPSKKANRSCSPNKGQPAARERSYTRRLGFTVASDLAGPRACISRPGPASPGQTNNGGEHSRRRPATTALSEKSRVVEGEPDPIVLVLYHPQ